jgi:predicted transposase YdaD
MAKPFDAASKHIVETYPGDWLALGGLPPGKSIEIADADLSAVSTAADKLIRVAADEPYVAHIEFQSGPDPGLDERVLAYHVLARHRMGLPVLSVAFLLRPQAMSPAIKGYISTRFGSRHRLEFEYSIVRVWELDPRLLLSGGIGTLPLAPISAVRKADLPAVIEEMKQRLSVEVSPEESREVWAATQILMGLRYSATMIKQLIRGVHGMEESTTYQAIIEKGIEKGIERGRSLEALAVLLRHGTKQFGRPSSEIKARLEAMSNVQQLENLMDRILDGSATDWENLLKASRNAPKRKQK